MTNETTPDAVEAALCKMYRIIVCDYGALSDMTVTATLALEGFLAERARHAEEVASHRAHASDLDDVIVAISRQRDHLRDQLRRVEGERDRMQRANETLAVRMDLPASQLLMVGSELCGDGKIDPNDHRDPRWTPTLQRAAEVMRELTARRAHDADVRALARWAIETEHMSDHVNTDQIGDVGRRILAALEPQGGEGE